MPKEIPGRGELDYEGSGLVAYVASHLESYEDAMALETRANKFMGGFRVFEQQQLRKLKRAKRMPDEDGWQTVVPKMLNVNTATTELRNANHIDDYNKKQEISGKKAAVSSSDGFSRFAESKKSMQRLIKMKKSLMKAQSRKNSVKTAGLRNFADRC